MQVLTLWKGELIMYIDESFDYQIDTAFDECTTFSEVAEWYSEIHMRIKTSMESRMKILETNLNVNK